MRLLGPGRRSGYAWAVTVTPADRLGHVRVDLFNDRVAVPAAMSLVPFRPPAVQGRFGPPPIRPPVGPADDHRHGRHGDGTDEERIDKDPNTYHEAGLKHRRDAGEHQTEHRSREDESGRQDHHPDRPCGEPHLAVHSQGLGSGAGVGHHERSQDRRHHGAGSGLVAPRGEVGPDRYEHDPLLEAVERRVEECAERGPLARHPRVAAIQRIHHRSDDERDTGQEEEPGEDQAGRGEVEYETRQRDRVRSQP